MFSLEVDSEVVSNFMMLATAVVVTYGFYWYRMWSQRFNCEARYREINQIAGIIGDNEQLIRDGGSSLVQMFGKLERSYFYSSAMTYIGSLFSSAFQTYSQATAERERTERTRLTTRANTPAIPYPTTYPTTSPTTGCCRWNPCRCSVGCPTTGRVISHAQTPVCPNYSMPQYTTPGSSPCSRTLRPTWMNRQSTSQYNLDTSAPEQTFLGTQPMHRVRAQTMPRAQSMPLQQTAARRQAAPRRQAPARPTFVRPTNTQRKRQNQTNQPQVSRSPTVCPTTSNVFCSQTSCSTPTRQPTTPNTTTQTTNPMDCVLCPFSTGATNQPYLDGISPETDGIRVTGTTTGTTTRTVESSDDETTSNSSGTSTSSGSEQRSQIEAMFTLAKSFDDPTCTGSVDFSTLTLTTGVLALTRLGTEIGVNTNPLQSNGSAVFDANNFKTPNQKVADFIRVMCFLALGSQRFNELYQREQSGTSQTDINSGDVEFTMTQ